ncbi:MAG: L,D-transpeptidase family protein [Hyphomicrobiales bacterium]|nr:L,D-transpeptidase family protein [Hyphomicrobiales bacterium]
MHAFRRALGAGLLVLVSAFPALAIEPDAPDALITRLDAVRISIIDRLDGKGKNAIALSKEEKTQFVEYYSQSESLLWVDEAGLTPRVAKTAEAFADAADWGLDPKAYTSPAAPKFDADSEGAASQLAEAELDMTLAVYAYAKHAQAGRVTPSTLGEAMDMQPQAPTLKEALEAVDRAGGLESFHPQHQQFLALKAKLAEARRAGVAVKKIDLIPSGPNIKPGAEHPQITLIRQRFDLAALDADRPNLYDEGLARAVKAYQKQNGLSDTGVIGAVTRDALNGGPGRGADVKQLLINMERWRWMKRDLGRMHVRVNIPEFMFRIVKNGAVIHEERIVTGKPEHMTPSFADEMETIVLNPSWHVPESIKVNEILPLLRRNPAYLEKQGLEVSYAGQRRPLSAYETDWYSINPDKVTIRQPPGDGNALGKVKFLFPNKHSVYMHDTPSKSLFNQSSRAFSHGCMRVRNPLKFAEIMLGEQGWTPARIQQELATGQEIDVALQRKTPVHVAYITAWVDDNGEVKTFRDIYGHDKVLAGELGLGPKFSPPKNSSGKPEFAAEPLQKKRPASTGFFWFN